jgi:hypothetical protein
MTADQAKILDLVCQSERFRNAPKRAQLLRYVVEKSTAPNLDKGQLSEFAILENLYTHLDPVEAVKTRNSAVRSDMKRVRQFVDDFFDAHSEHSQRICIPVGRYFASFVPNTPRQDDDSFFWKFWEPFLSAEQKVPLLILYTEPLIFQSKDGKVFVRDLRRNARKAAHPKDVHMDWPEYPANEWEPCFNYVAAGEIRCTMELSSWLQGEGVTCRPEVSRRFPELKLIENQNLLLLGSPRSNWLVELTQKKNRLPIQAMDFHIEVSNGRGEAPDKFIDLESDDPEATFRPIYTVVSRCPSPITGRWALLVSSNHARAYEAVAEFLKSPKHIGVLAERLHLTAADDFPPAVQMLLSVDVDEFQTPIGQASIVACSPEKEGGGVP